VSRSQNYSDEDIAQLLGQLEKLKEAEKLEHCLYRIASISQAELSLNEIYQQLHEIIGELLYARNFFIGLLDEEAQLIRFPYFVDEKDQTLDKTKEPIKLGEGISSYVIKARRPQFLTPDRIDKLIATGEMQGIHGSTSFHYWLGVPIISSNVLYGIMVLQSYDPAIKYKLSDLDLLDYVANHVAIAIEATINSEQRKQAQLKLAEQHRELAQQNSQLTETVSKLQKAQAELVQQEKMASLGGLVAGIAHEINTPLGICVTGISHLSEEYKLVKSAMTNNKLTETGLTEFFDEVEESINIVTTNMKRAASLVNSFKQVAVDQSSNEIRDVNIAQYIDEIIVSLRPKLKRTKHQVTVNCPMSLNFKVNAGAISQVVSNLIMNSLIHAFHEKEQGQIKIDVEEKAGFILLRYADNGSGISEEDLEQLFEPFFTTKRGEGGSGLGTHLVYNIVTNVLNGKITVQSKLGKGTAYLIKFPKA